MKKTIRRILALAFSLLGTVLALYLGGYWLFIRPVRFLYTGFLAGTLTRRSLLICIIKIFFASTAGGGIWVICDIIAGHFRDE
ncbi:MAG: hypothetical protein PUB19_01625 [Lachnospiraceae bacterium]|nr:hypothetical protein [Lachnospiraceae bacterium]